MEHRHGMTLERLREHLARADGELEALQTLRIGGAAPLARVDVDGLAGS